MFFRFLLHRFCVFLYVYSWIMHILRFFVRFSFRAKRVLAVFQSAWRLFVSPKRHKMRKTVNPLWQKSPKSERFFYRIFLYFMMFSRKFRSGSECDNHDSECDKHDSECDKHGSEWGKHESEREREKNSRKRIDSQKMWMLFYGNECQKPIAARPEGAKALSPGQRPGYKAFSNTPCKGKSFKTHGIF